MLKINKDYPGVDNIQKIPGQVICTLDIEPKEFVTDCKPFFNNGNSFITDNEKYNEKLKNTVNYMNIDERIENYLRSMNINLVKAVVGLKDTDELPEYKPYDTKQKKEKRIKATCFDTKFYINGKITSKTEFTNKYSNGGFNEYKSNIKCNKIFIRIMSNKYVSWELKYEINSIHLNTNLSKGVFFDDSESDDDY